MTSSDREGGMGHLTNFQGKKTNAIDNALVGGICAQMASYTRGVRVVFFRARM